jgi:CRISPR-associated protein Cmr2
MTNKLFQIFKLQYRVGVNEVKKDLSNFLKHLWLTTENDPNDLNEAVRSWMKLAAFMTRKREIKIGGSI